MSPPLKRVRVTEPQPGAVTSPSASTAPQPHAPQMSLAPPDGLPRRMQAGQPLPPPRQQVPLSFEPAPHAAAASPRAQAAWDGAGPVPSLGALFPDMFPPSLPGAAEPTTAPEPDSPSGNVHFQADPAALDAALARVATSPGGVAARREVPPGVDLERIKTPRGFHVSEYGKAVIQRMYYERPRVPQRLIASRLTLNRASVTRALRPPKPEPAPGHLTPEGKNLSEAGRLAILDMNRQRPQPTPEDINAVLRLGVVRVRRIVADDAIPAWPDGMRGRDGDLTAFGRQEIIRRHEQDPLISARAMARSLGIARHAVDRLFSEHARKLEAQRQEQATRAEPVAQAPTRPVAQVADWHEVVQRGWNAGDRFTLPMEGGPALFEVTRHRQQGDAFDPRDFRPVIRGG